MAPSYAQKQTSRSRKRDDHTIEREVNFGEQVCGIRDFRFVTGILYVGPQHYGEETGKPYRIVILLFKDQDNHWCKIRRIYWDRQGYHGDELKAYNEQVVRLGVYGINTKKVEQEIDKQGKPLYVYPAREIFLDERPQLRFSPDEMPDVLADLE